MTEQRLTVNQRTSPYEVKTGIAKPQPMPDFVTHEITTEDQAIADRWLQNGYNASQAVAFVRFNGKTINELTKREQTQCRGHAGVVMKKMSVRNYLFYRRWQMSYRNQVSLDSVVADAAMAVFTDRAEMIAKIMETSNLRNLSPDERALIESCEVDTYMDGRGEEARPVKRIKLKLVNKTEARDQLFKFLGGYQKNNEQLPDSKMLILNVDLKSMTPEQKSVLVAQLAQEQALARQEIQDAVCCE